MCAIIPKQINLLIYIPTEEIQESLLIKLIGKHIPQFRIEIFREVEDFRSKLKERRFEFTAAVVFAPDRQDISDVLSLEHFLRDIQIILIISQENHGTLSMAHFLRPRFISYFSHLSKEIDAGEITSVLRKMFEYQISCHYMTQTCPTLQ